ncbi:hypothetical protein [Actinomadura sp. SCN-SB]|uniref:hypothetical protein n=1 Tax=Actinomadura sp. SCN-SB TaxID=3373092 RepID=UPI0037527F0A
MSPEKARAAAEVEHRIPGTRAWFGEHTGAWWAMTIDRYGTDRLIEAADPVDLLRRLEAIGAHPATRPIQTGTAARSALTPPHERRGVPPHHRRHERGWFLGVRH